MKKIKDYKNTICLHPEHNPPGHVVLSPGEYEHECPSCHRKIKVVVPMVIC